MTQRSVTSEGRRLVATESGSGEVALLLHSGGLSGRQWRRLALALEPHMRVVVPDLLGYGASDAWPNGEPFHFDQDLAALEVLMEDLPAPLHLVGHSYGGLLALKLALRHRERIGRLALFEPVAFGVLDETRDADAIANLTSVNLEWTPEGDAAFDERWLREFVEWWNGRGAWDVLTGDVRETFRRSGWKVYQEVLALGADRTPQDAYHALSSNVLLLSGGRTPLAEQRVVQRLAEALPNARVQTFDKLGHMAPVTHADAVNEAIVAHLLG